LLKRDKVNLDIFWLRDESLEDSANLPDPDVLALEISEELEAPLGAICGNRGGFEALTPIHRPLKSPMEESSRRTRRNSRPCGAT